MTPEQLEAAIKKGLPDARVKIVDLTGTQDHYQAIVGSDAFEGKSLLEQHKMVYEAVGAEVGNAVHALTLKTVPLARFDEVAGVA
ncbi:MAG: BolA family transcriptional regulator [Deltaproteobacteria bacterium]|nr:MAG: BolA family transcriptional regulator [Deltaproteobacteria bacterium]